MPGPALVPGPCDCDPIPNLGPPEGRVFRLRHGDGLVTPPGFCQHDRDLVADRAVWSFLVVVSAPILQLFGASARRQEPVGVQAFRPEAAVERLDERIVGRLAGPGEVRASRRAG